MISCGAALTDDDGGAPRSGARLAVSSSSTGKRSVKGAALARMSFAGSASCWKTTEFELLITGSASAGVGLTKLANATMPATASTKEVATQPATIMLAWRWRRRKSWTRACICACGAGLATCGSSGRPAAKRAELLEVVAVAGLGAHREGEVLEKEAKLLVVRSERPQPCPERAGQRHGESFAPRMRLRFNLRIGPLMNARIAAGAAGYAGAA